jgi:hypothetical protein
LKKYKESTKEKASSLKKINNIDKTLTNLTEMRKEKIEISKIRSKKREITTNTKKIQVIIMNYFEDLYSN